MSITVAKLSWPNVVFFTAMHALALWGIFFFSWQAMLLLLIMHWVTGSLGICLGYHRLLSHRSFQMPRWLEYGFATIGALAIQGGPIFWIAGHRKHHSFTEDEEKDPYSARRGVWWSHMGWILQRSMGGHDRAHLSQFAGDLVKQPYYRWLDKYFLVLQLPLAVALFAVGEYVFAGLGWSFVIYGIFVRAVLVWHSTWLINSACHKWGYRTFQTNDHSTNLWWAALLTHGEGWHNNHHAWPKCAKAGVKWWEFDPTWMVIRTLQACGLVRHVTLRS